MTTHVRGNIDPVVHNIAANSATQSNNNGSGHQINNYYNAPYQDEETRRAKSEAKKAKQKAKEVEEEKRVCLGSLPFPTMNYRLADIAPPHPETCDWLFSTPEFQEWLDPRRLSAHNGVLWIKGKPGTGKSTLMKHAFNRYKECFFPHYRIITHLFNARGSALEKTPLGMLRSIVYQLIHNDNELCKTLAPFFHEKCMTSGGHLQWRASELKDLIRSLVKIPQTNPLLLLVDALDECGESEVRDVVSFIESLSICDLQYNTHLRICLSSRHYPGITMGKFLQLTVESCPHHRSDIAKYVRGMLRVRDLGIEAKIRKKANGIFLWVVLVISLLNKAHDEGRDEAMPKALDTIPGDIDQIFSDILVKNITDSAETILMLQWVLLSKRPLTPEELFAAVIGRTLPAISTIQRRIIDSSKGLIEIRKGKANSVQFIHKSVSDFLLRQNRLLKLDPTLRPEPIVTSHSRLWARCLSFIRQIDAPLTDAQLLRDLKGQIPFLGYSLGHVLEHAEEALCAVAVGNADNECTGDSSLSDLSKAFLENSKDIRTWLHKPDRWFGVWEWLFYIQPGELEGNADAQLLCTVASCGYLNLMRILLDDSKRHRQRGCYDHALQAASLQGHQEIVRLLIEKGADVNAKSGEYRSALYSASSMGHEETARLLLEMGAEVNQQDCLDRPLPIAILAKHEATARLLIEKGADVNVQGGCGGTVLHQALYSGQPNIVRLLLDKGANVNAPNSIGQNVLHAAIRQCPPSIELVNLLLRKGADVNAQDFTCYNALHTALICEQQIIDLIALLLEAGADMSMRDWCGRNALDLAMEGQRHHGFSSEAQRHKDIVECLTRLIRVNEIDVS